MSFDCIYLGAFLCNILIIRYMNKILCNRLEFCFLHEVDVTYPGTCKLKNGYKFHYLPTDEVELTISNKISDPGALKTETVKIKTGADCAFLTRIPTARVILVLTTSENEKYIVGSIQYPATYTYQEKIPVTEITFTANS